MLYEHVLYKREKFLYFQARSLTKEIFLTPPFLNVF